MAILKTVYLGVTYRLKGLWGTINRLFYPQPQILDSVTSLTKIMDEKCSVARFGDGEFNLMRGGDWDFKKPIRYWRKGWKRFWIRPLKV